MGANGAANGGRTVPPVVWNDEAGIGDSPDSRGGIREPENKH